MLFVNSNYSSSFHSHSSINMEILALSLVKSCYRALFVSLFEK
mgnify:CR=1 FL=1